MPYKENIYNRQDGIVTMPGNYWRPNSTFPIKKSIFIRSTARTSGAGGYELQLASPDPKSWMLYDAQICGKHCYGDLSFILWYMDKNRPLPPGTAFDPYRERDFNRRKAEGFPKPLFPADFDTPEATPKQQAERWKIGGW